MVKKYAGRYSKYLRPISIIFDLLVVSSFVYLFLDKSLFKVTPILIFCALWIIPAIITKFLYLLELIFSFSNLDIIYPVSNNSDGQVSNTHEIGKVLYTEYFLPFQIAGCILLVAMLGAIILTLRKREGVLRQNISEQVSRKKEDSMELIKLEKK